MREVEQPRSPHLQIYRPQLTSVLSISHRLTGIMLSAGSIVLVIWLIAAATGPRFYSAMQQLLGTGIGKALMLGWTFSLFFHLCNGVRHLVWDSGRGFELRTIYASGWTVVVVSMLLTVLAWVASFMVAG